MVDPWDELALEAGHWPPRMRPPRRSRPEIPRPTLQDVLDCLDRGRWLSAYTTAWGLLWACRTPEVDDRASERARALHVAARAWARPSGVDEAAVVARVRALEGSTHLTPADWRLVLAATATLAHRPAQEAA